MTKSRKHRERGKKDLSQDWVKIWRRIFTCVFGVDMFSMIFGEQVQSLINWTFITVTILSILSFSLSVSYETFLFKGICQWTVCQIRHCVTNERLLARHVRVKKRGKNTEKINRGQVKGKYYDWWLSRECVCFTWHPILLLGFQVS